MMYQYPYYGFPFFRRSRYSNYYPNYTAYQEVNANTTKTSQPTTPVIEKQKQDRKEERSDDAFFEIFGIRLYFDDILLICLIFFLYNEGVKDQSLFISLILLLLS